MTKKRFRGINYLLLAGAISFCTEARGQNLEGRIVPASLTRNEYVYNDNNRSSFFHGVEEEVFKGNRIDLNDNIYADFNSSSDKEINETLGANFDLVAHSLLFSLKDAGLLNGKLNGSVGVRGDFYSPEGRGADYSVKTTVNYNGIVDTQVYFSDPLGNAENVMGLKISKPFSLGYIGKIGASFVPYVNANYPYDSSDRFSDITTGAGLNFTHGNINTGIYYSRSIYPSGDSADTAGLKMEVKDLTGLVEKLGDFFGSE